MDSIITAKHPGQLVGDFSLEITGKDIAALEETRSAFPAGTQVSVTSLPTEDFATRVDAAVRVAALGLKPVPHISARRLESEEELTRFLSTLSGRIALNHVFVIAGDLAQPAGPYADALAVIATGLLQRHGVKTVGISGYPEGHPDISEALLWKALKDKQALLADFGLGAEIVTQFAFDADPVLDWLQRVREEGVHAPVRVGVPGPASVKTLLRYAARCGVGASARVMAKYGLSITQLLNSAGPDALVAELAARLDPHIHGDVRLHFYPFGGLAKTAEWLKKFAAAA